jgi:hypothetical protein
MRSTSWQADGDRVRSVRGDAATIAAVLATENIVGRCIFDCLLKFA